MNKGIFDIDCKTGRIVINPFKEKVANYKLGKRMPYVKSSFSRLVKVKSYVNNQKSK